MVFLGVGRWYVASNSERPLHLGVSFIADYAESLGLDAEETMDALIDDVGVEHFRLVSYWNKIEPTPGTYDFSELDWQFEKAETADAKVTLAIGLRQPRWPECHEPAWAAQLPDEQWRLALDQFITSVVQRYKSSPSLVSYQLENEFLLEAFGECRDFSRERVADEFALVKTIDGDHPIILTRSNNIPSLVLGEPLPDEVGVSIYRRVWNENIYKGYFDYPLPSWYYAGIAGLQKLFTGRDSMVHELQMEPWPPGGQSLTDISLKEQDKSMNASMFASRVQFAEQTGMRDIYLWGAEWWYYRKVVMHDDSVWEAAKHVFDDTAEN